MLRLYPGAQKHLGQIWVYILIAFNFVFSSMRKFFIAVFVIALALVLPASLRAQEHAKRLILKDGSYQFATKWEVQRDRVHYYSAERYDWEDLPSSLVDWDATNKFNKENPRGLNPNLGADELKQADAEEKAEREKEEAARPLVAPGLHLPDTGGVFVLDHYRGQPQLVEVVQNGGELNKQMGKNIMRGIINPIPTGSKQSIELKGASARVQAHETTPAIYVDVTASSPDSSENKGNQPSPELNRPDRFKIVRVQAKKDARVVSNVKISLLGKVSDQEDIVPANAEVVSNGEWVKLTPAHPLAPGEYALVEMLDPKTINMFVWDFGVNPNAPANATAWTPQPVKEKPTATDASPVLSPRPK
ncbi:MAG: hypothetical protein DMG60_05830 [Acidobacteria bacterium]|nr:MAG: hypothetical protein DMG60_05830 [Acidobacteriota bacterium]